MHSYRFIVDGDLKIHSLDFGAGKNLTHDFAHLVGVPYYQVFPRILMEGRDAVELALKEGIPVQLPAYRYYCCFASESVDISIYPIITHDKRISGAIVSVTANQGCAPLGSSFRDQRFIEIGKNSAAIAHGVRTPLNAIKGAVVYLKEKYKKETTLVEFSEIIEEEISKLDAFITKFLSSSVIDSDMLYVDVNEILGKILSMLKFQALAKDIVFTHEFSEIPPVKADSFKLEHAVMNVINNSMEAIDEEGSIFLKTATAKRDTGDFVMIEVNDTGRGMSPKTLEGLSDTTQSAGKKDGRGFGLFITREIVQYHGGLLEILSRKKTGTSVRILLPI